jgi:transcription-repair coupling factor (superfamily II helicase)
VAAVGYDLYCEMVTEVVAELKGEPKPEPVDITIDVPFDAHLSPDYVPAEEQRLEAYRRLAAVTTHGQVDDIAAEWADRYGPVPPAAQALLEVAHLRAECSRVGIREVVVTKGAPGGGFGGPSHTARLSPLPLRASQKVRLERLVKGGFYKEELEQVQVPIKKASETVSTLTAFLELMAPAPAAD